MATRIATFEIKKNADLDLVVGKKIGAVIRSLRSDTMTRLPKRVSFYHEKPEFHLNDGDTLRAYAVDLTTGEIIGERYCGSADTAIHHPEQGMDGGSAPDNHALMFIETYWNGRNTGWHLHVISTNIAKQLPGA